MQPNRCAWLPCRKALTEVRVPSAHGRQFCCDDHLQKWAHTRDIAREQQQRLDHDQLAFWPVAHRSST